VPSVTSFQSSTRNSERMLLALRVGTPYHPVVSIAGEDETEMKHLGVDRNGGAGRNAHRNEQRTVVGYPPP
jgi:hypothetical protein